MARARILALVLVCLTFPAVGLVNVEAANSPTLSVQLGYHGVVRVGEWMPVDIQVSTKSSAADGNLEVQVNDSSAGYLARQNFSSQPNPFGPTYTTAYDVSVHVPAGSSTDIRTFVLTDVQNPSVSVRLLPSGPSARASARTTRLLVGVLADRPTAFDSLATAHLPSSLTPSVVPLTAADLPDSALLLRAFDLIVVDDFPTATLSPEQQQALADYVNLGGALLIGTGDTYVTTVRGLPAPLIPIDIQGMMTLPRATALPGVTGLTVVTGNVRPGGVWLREGAQPLIGDWPVGNGIVTLATFSFAAPPIANWSGTIDLLRQITIRSSLRIPQSSAAPVSLVPGHGPIWGPLGFQGSVIKRSWFLMPDLGQGPAPSLPSELVIGLLLGGYALVVGLLVYFALRRKRRPAWLWLIAPVVALLPAGTIWLVAPRGASATVNQFSVTYDAQGWQEAYEEAFTAVRPGQTGDYRIGVLTSRLIAPFAVGYGPNASIGVGIRIEANPLYVNLLHVESSSVRGYATEAVASSSGLDAFLTLVNGRLKGQVHNGSGVHYFDAVLLAGTSIVNIGDLPPGVTAPIDAALTTSTTNGGSLTSLQIYPNSLGAPPPAAPLKGDGRISLLQLILGEYDTSAAQLQPTLLAWQKAVVEPSTINGIRPDVNTQNVVVVPVPIGQVSSGPLPAGFVAPRLVDANGQVTFDQFGTAVTNGSVSYEFSVPVAPTMRISGLALRFASAPGPFPPPAVAGSSGPQAESSAVWDWSRSTWVPVTLVDGAATSLPQGALQPDTGLVRLRIASPAGATFRLGSLWLEGSVG